MVIVKVPGADAPNIYQELAQTMSKMVVAHAQDPMVWFRFLVAEGKHLPLLLLDASARARLGAGVERQIRCVQKIEHSKTPPADDSGKIFQVSLWVTREMAREGLTALSDLHAFQKQEGESFPGLKDAVATLGKKLNESLKELAQSLTNKKSELSPVHKDTGVVLEALKSEGSGPEAYSAEVKAVVQKYNTPENQKSPVEQSVTCAWSAVSYET